MLAIFKKEMRSYFYSPMAYVLIGLFIALVSAFFTQLLTGRYGDFTPMMGTISFFLIFLIPILTMRLLTEDRKSGVEVLLMTSPVSVSSVVVGKYLSALAVFLGLTALTWIYPLILVAFGGEILPQLAGAYAGYVLLGASFIAFGVFASALTENQIIAAVISVTGFLIMQVAEPLGADIGGIAGTILTWFSLVARYRVFTSGVFEIAPIVYFLSFIALFLFLTVRVVERRRWSAS